MKKWRSGTVASLGVMGLVVGAGSALASVAQFQTLDRLKTEAAGYLSSNPGVINLSTTSETGSVPVVIDGTSFYFVPSGEHAALLTTLAGSSAGQLVESSAADGLFFDAVSGKYYSFNVESIPHSAFEMVNGTDVDYSFAVPEAAEDGSLTHSYYKINMKTSEFGSAERFAWNKVSADGANTVKVTLPHGMLETSPGVFEPQYEDHYYHFVYTPTDGRTYFDNDRPAAGSLTGDINADFLNNSTLNATVAYGGGYSNASNIGHVHGDFVRNIITGAYGYSSAFGGGLAHFGGSIKSITGDFIGNNIYLRSGTANGGAIYAASGIGDVTGDFVGNYLSATVALGGAIYNTSTVGNVTGDFIGNYSLSGNGQGGAIYNGATLGDITGDFIGNYVEGNGSSGAIYNAASSTMGNINGNFIGNYVNSPTSIVSDTIQSGALYNKGIMGNINGDFIGNYILTTGLSKGGALFSDSGSQIGIINGSFIGNFGKSTGNRVLGGAIYNFGGRIAQINGDFIANYIEGTGSSSGGALHNEGTIGGIKGNINGNYIKSTATFGGAIFNSGTIGEKDTNGQALNGIRGNFTNNYALATTFGYGGAIYTNTSSNITYVDGDFVNNSVTSSGNTVYGGALYNTGTIGSISGDFSDNKITTTKDAYGGAIYNNKAIGQLSGNFMNNSAEGDSLALGGAIYSAADLMSFLADGKDYLFSGNYVQRGSTKSYNGIFVDTGYSSGRKLSFDLKNNGSYTLNDTIWGGRPNLATFEVTYDYTYNLDITGDGSETSFNLNNAVINAGNVTVTDSRLKLGSHKYADAAKSYGLFLAKPDDAVSPSVTKLTLDGATLHLDYGTDYQQLKLASITAQNDSSIIFGGNFVSHISDQINARTADSTQSIRLRAINMSGGLDLSNLGANYVDLFSNQSTGYLDIANKDSFALIFDGHLYSIDYAQGRISIKADEGFAYPIYVAETEQFDTVDMEDTNMDAKSGEGILVNDGTTTINNSHFSNNSNSGNDHSAAGDGGVIMNGTDGMNGDLLITESSFESNHSDHNGGAIAHNVGSVMVLQNTSFSHNTAAGLGGAIYSEEDFLLSADGKTVTLADNADGSGANDIYMGQDTSLILQTSQGGEINLNSGLSGAGDYVLDIRGDNSGSVNLNAAADNVREALVNHATLKLKEESFLSEVDMSLEHGSLDIANQKIADMYVNNLSSTSGYVHLDIDPANNSADVLHVAGEFSGTVNLVLNALNPEGATSNILFAETPNATVGAGKFEVYRVMGSPFNWGTMFDEGAMSWYLQMHADGGEVASEVMGYLALPSASIEQTRSMVGSIKAKIGSNKMLYQRCGLYDECYNGEPLYNAWVNPVYYSSTVKRPAHMEADVYGLEAGFDVQQNAYHKLGVFGSYRRGDYDLSGRGEDYYSPVKSDLDIDSYLGGLYYRYDRNKWWGFATLYGGVQKAELKTKDGVRAKTDGVQLGTSVEFGYAYDLQDNWVVEPSVGASYSQVDFDKLRDQYGKTAKYETLRHGEIELGVKLEKGFELDEGRAKLYVKPSVIQNITDGDGVAISGLDQVEGYHDEMMGRLEFGGRYAISDDLAAYGTISYTKSRHYNATNFSLGLNYSW